MNRSILALLALTVGFVGTAHAQFNDQWVEFTKNAAMLSSSTISDTNNETDVDWGDLNGDGFIDLVVVRKEPFTSPGKRTNVLLMNESGVLTNRTSQYATQSDVGGDNGFLTATNDRDVRIDDFDQDGRLDFVTATTISDGDPKHVGHPRIYRNLGFSGANWNGMRFENARIPQLFHYGNGTAQNPRFCSVATGDVTTDGYPDLYFGDYDSSGAGGAQQGSSQDLNNRLLINDGNGFFSDHSQSRLPSNMITSAFGAASVIADMNGDGLRDIVRQSALNPPQNVKNAYNLPGNPGFFSVTDEIFSGNAPYHVNVGDLNKDGRLDIVESDDNADRFMINTGTDALGRVIWSASKTYSFLTGGDDGFASNNLVADLNNDGWNDVLICDVDVDIGSYARRLHIYHNRGGTVGSTNITLREERQSSSSSAWIGVVGLHSSDMTGTHDVAVFDVDNDGDNDMVISRKDGTDVWENLLIDNPPVICQPSIGFGNHPTATLSVCGGSLATGTNATLQISGLPTNATPVVFAGFQSNPTVLGVLDGLTLVPMPFFLVLPLANPGTGTVDVTVPGGKGPLSIYTQVVLDQPTGKSATNAVRIDFQP